MASMVTHHAGAWAKVGRHSAGCVTGLSMLEFLSLPPKARISVAYRGDDKVEAFLSLRKL